MSARAPPPFTHLRPNRTLMSFLRFDKTQMTNLQESLMKEFLLTNKSGAYCSSTLTGCNIRKYHGLFVVPVPALDDENHVLLSSLDETVVQHGAEFNLGLHKYVGDNFSPRGHKYIQSFEWDKVPTWIYRIGGVVLKKEIIFRNERDRLFIRYTLLEAHSPTTLRLRPFLAFRSVRQWTHENGTARTEAHAVEQGVSFRLYEGYPDLVMQLDSPAAVYHHTPDWYRGLDYPKERERGYDEPEDLFVPGYFEMPIARGESIVFTASLDARDPATLKPLIADEIEAHDPRDSFYHTLVNAAHQFRQQLGGLDYIIAGYPWFKPRARDTFIAMPGLTLAIGETEQFEKYMDTAARALDDFMGGRPVSVQIYETEQPDTLLWAMWCLQQYAKYVGRERCRERYGTLIDRIMSFIFEGRHPNLFVHTNGLVYANGRDRAVTWMNSTAWGRPIVPARATSSSSTPCITTPKSSTNSCWSTTAAPNASSPPNASRPSAGSLRRASAPPLSTTAAISSTTSTGATPTGAFGPTNCWPSPSTSRPSRCGSAKPCSTSAPANSKRPRASAPSRPKAKATRPTTWAVRKIATAPTTKAPPGRGSRASTSRPTCASTA